MNVSKCYPWLTLVLILVSPLIMIFALTTTMAAASPSERLEPGISAEQPIFRAELSPTVTVAITATTLSQSSRGEVPPPQPSLSAAATGDVLEVFTNTWSYSTIGLVYDPDHNLVRYAHESQSSSHRPTVYDVEPVAYTVPLSFALSAQNSGWPWQIYFKRS